MYSSPFLPPPLSLSSLSPTPHTKAGYMRKGEEVTDEGYYWHERNEEVQQINYQIILL